jgi:transcription elongation factor Elf1
MFASVVCPACQYKDSIPEGDMGKRLICPNCKCPFLAGRSADEADVPMKLQAGADPGFNKTMLTDSGPPIRFNCPRCKKPLEVPAIDAGVKKPCPACGQRLQVPATSTLPAPAAPQRDLNKTLLAGDESKPQPPIRYNCPTCKKPLESPAIEAGVKKPCPACGQRLQVPAAPPPGTAGPNLSKTLLASDESSAKPAGIQAGQPAGAPSAPGLAPSVQPGTVPATQIAGFALTGSPRT